MTLVWLALGAFLGWNLPQPFWAKMFQAFVVKKWKEFKSK